MYERPGLENSGRAAVPIDIAVKGMAGKSRVIDESTVSLSPYPRGSSSQVPQATTLASREGVSSSDVGHEHEPNSLARSAVTAAPTELAEHLEQKQAASKELAVREAARSSDPSQDHLRSLTDSTKVAAATKQPGVDEQDQAAFPAGTTLTNNVKVGPKSTSHESQSVLGKLGTPPALPAATVTSSAGNSVKELVSAPSPPTVHPGNIKSIKSTSVREPAGSLRLPLTIVQNNSEDSQKSILKDIIRLEAFLTGVLAELEHGNASIKPQSIRLEALIQGAASELASLCLVLESQPTSQDRTMGPRRSATTHMMRLWAFLTGAVTEQEFSKDDKITAHSLRLEALLGGAIVEFKDLRLALGT